MRINSIFTTIIITLLSAACNVEQKEQENLAEKSKQEILQVEKDFAEEVRKNGMITGFTKYAAPDAVMNFGDSLVFGRPGIENYYKSRNVEKNKLEWTAKYVDAAASGDLGYTYGDYVYTVVDSTGRSTEYKGVFHSVWKKQADGTWKFVWD